MSATADNSGKPKRKRRWFQFSLRTLFVLVTLFCICLALWVVPARKQGAAVAAIKALGGGVGYHERHQELTDLEWLLMLVGEEYFGTINEVSFHNKRVTDADLEHLKGLTSLKWLHLDRTKVTDVGLEHLEGLTRLQGLDLNNTKATEEGAMKLQKALPNCKIFRHNSDDP